MAAPVSNDTPLSIGSPRARSLEQGKAPNTPARSDSPESSSPEYADSVTLSEAAKQLSEQHAHRRPATPEEAQRLVEQIREKLSANPAFAAAVHKVDDAGKLEILLDSFA